MARAMIGVGPALRRARENRGKSIDEASRDTKIRGELLRALEKERFDALPGDVYVRGFLRSYGQYLGLDPDKVVSLYSEHAALRPETVKGPGPMLSDEPTESELRPRGASSWVLAVGIALTLFIIAAATGLLSGSNSTPDSAPLPRVVLTSPPPPDERVLVEMHAVHAIEAKITIDGSVEFEGELEAKEARTYRAADEIEVEFAKGDVVRLIVNREDLGSPGSSQLPFVATYTPDSGAGIVQEASPTPSPEEAPSRAA